MPDRPFLRQPLSPHRSPPVIPDPIPTPFPQWNIPRVNQANSSEAYYPAVAQPIPERNRQSAFPLQERVSNSSSEEAHRSSQDTDHCYFPERIYVSSVLPTRNSSELRGFHRYCRRQFAAYQNIEIVYELPIRLAQDITTSALHFQNLLWKNRTTISSTGIVEEYSWIRRQARNNSIDQAILRPAYTVTYPWNTEGWTVTRTHRTAFSE